MPTLRFRFRVPRAVPLLLALALRVSSSGQVWDGGGNDNFWLTSANWSPNSVPANNGSAQLSFAGTTRLTPNADAAWSVSGLTFSAGAGAFTVSGAQLTIGASGITNNSSNLQTLANAVDLGADQTWNAGAAGLTVSGIVSGAGKLTKTGSGVLLLSGANTYTGKTRVSAGTLRLGASSTATTGELIVDAAGAGQTATYDLNGFNATFAHVQLAGGDSTSTSTNNIATGNGTLTLAGNVQFEALNDPLGSTISGKLNLGNADRNFAINSSSNAAIELNVSAVISGTGGLNKIGAGTMQLSGVNTYTGNTTVTRGTLQLGVSQTMTTTNLVVASGNAGPSATYNLSDYDATFASVTLGGSTAFGSQIVSNNGTLTLGGPLTFDATGDPLGAAVSGRLSLGTGTRVFTIGDSASAATDLSISASISGTGGLTKAGAGTLALSGFNTYTGGTTVAAGTLQLDASNILADSGALAVTGGTLSLGANSDTVGAVSITAGSITGSGVLTGTSFAFNVPSTASASAVLGGTGGLTVSGGGNVTLSANNTFTGDVHIQNGTLTVSKIADGGLASGLGAGSNPIRLGSGATTGTLVFTGGSNSTYRGLDLAGTTGGGRIVNNGYSLTIGGNFTASGSGAKTLSLGGTTDDLSTLEVSVTDSANGATALIIDSSGAWKLTGVNTYTGGTTVSSGTLQIGANHALPSTGALTVQSGNLNLSEYNVTVGPMTFTEGDIFGGGSITATSFTFGTNGFSSISTNLNGTGGLIMNGAGTLALNGTNGFTGAVHVQSGAVEVSSLSDQGAAGPFGAGMSAVKLGHLGELGAVYFYGSSPLSTNRGFDLAGTTGGAVLSNDGESTVLLSGNITASGSGAKTLMLTGENSAGATISGVISDSAGGATSLAKEGYGTWILTGTNTYTGTTSISAGTLQIGAGGTSGSVAGNIVNDADLVFNRSDSVTFSGVISGPGNVTQAGTGVLTLTGNNSFEGDMLINRGTVAVGLLANAGQSSPLGAGLTPILLGFDTVDGTLRYTGAGSSSNRGIDLYGGSGGGILESAGTGALLLSGNVTASGYGEKTLTLTGNNTGNNTISGVIMNSGDGDTRLVKAGSGLWVLSGNNTFSGSVKIQEGSLSVNTLANSWTNSALGQTGLIELGNGTTTGTLVYTGGTAATDRTFDLAGTTGGGRIVQDGTGALTFTGSFSASGNGVKTLELAGTNTNNNTIAGSTYDSGDGATNLLKSGAGTWVLAGSLYHTGGTTVAAGTLALGANNPIVYSTPLAVTGGTFDLRSFSIDVGAVTVSGGTVTGGGTLTGSSFVLNPAATATISAALGGEGPLTMSGTGVATLSGNSTFVGVVHVQSGTLEATTLAATGTPSAIGQGSSALKLGAASSTGTLLYSGTGGSTNRPLELAGTTGGATLASSGTGAITFSGNVTVSANGTKTLTLAGSNTGANTLGSAVPDSAAGATALAKTGTGTWILAGVNTFTGGTTISAGTLQLGGSNTLANTGAVTLTGGTLALGGFSETVGTVTVAGGSITGSGALTGAAFDFTTVSTALISANLAGTGALTMSGTGVVTLTGANSFTGPVHVQNGTLALDTLADGGLASALGAGSSAFKLGHTTGTGGLTYTGTGGSTNRALDLAGTTGGAILASSGTGALTLSGAVSASGSGAKTLTLTGTNTGNNTLSGVISDSGGGATALAKSGTGTWVLAGSNTYSGGTTINAGTLVATNPNSLGTGAITLNGGILGVNSGVTLANAVAFGPSGGTLRGNGTWGGAIAVGSNVVLAPGDSPGTLTFTGAVTWAPAGAYSLEVLSANGNAPGATHDTIVIASGGSLNISASNGSPFYINLISLSSAMATGNVPDFNNLNSYSWQIASSTSAITGFSTTAFAINTANFSNSLGAGQFFVTLGGPGGNTALFLNFSPIPEPSTYALLAAGAGLLVLLQRRRR